MTDPTPTTDTQPLLGEARTLSRAQVGAQVLQNFAGGCGVAIAIGAVQWLAYVPLEAHWRWPLGFGVLVFGAATAIRAYLDEWKSWKNLRAVELTYKEEMAKLVAIGDKFEDERNAALADLAAVTHERDRLQAENASLSYEWRKAKATPRTVLVEDLIEPQAKQDARHLVRLWAMHGKRPSRADVVPAQMTRARFDAAYSELTGAHIIGADTMTEAQMLHALDVRWSAPYPVSDGQPGAPTTSAGWAARLPAQNQEANCS